MLSTTSVLVLAKERNGLGPWCVCSKIGPGSSRFVVGILLEKMDRSFSGLLSTSKLLNIMPWAHVCLHLCSLKRNTEIF